MGAARRQAEVAAFISDRVESFAQGLQRSSMSADDREFQLVSGKMRFAISVAFPKH